MSKNKQRSSVKNITKIRASRRAAARPVSRLGQNVQYHVSRNGKDYKLFDYTLDE